MASSTTLPVRLLRALTCLTIMTSAATASATVGDTLSSDWCRSRAQHGTLIKTGGGVLNWQSDGNLVLFNRQLCADPVNATCYTTAAAIWTSGTHNRGETLCFAADGEMFIKNAADQRIFSTNTGGAAFQHIQSGGYLQAAGGGGGALSSGGPANHHHERFDIIPQNDGTGTVALRGYHNVHYVNLDGNVTSTAVGDRERFYIENNGDGSVAIRSARYANDFLADASADPDEFLYLGANGVQAGFAPISTARAVDAPGVKYDMQVVDTLSLSGCALSLSTPASTVWTVGGCAPSPDSMKQEFTRSEVFGNENFAAGYGVSVGFEQPYEGYTRAFAGGAAFARIFGQHVNIIGAGAQAVSDNNVHSSKAGFNLLGIQIPITLPGAERDLFTPFERTFFTQSTTFMAGPIPIYVSGSVTGTAGMTGKFDIGGSGGSVTVAPYLDVSLSVEAGIGASFGGCTLGAGVNATISLINVSTPFTLAIDFLLQEVALTGDLVITTLSGSVSLVANACMFSKSLELGSWPPAAEETFPLVSKTYGWGGDEVVKNTLRNYWRSNEYIHVSGGALFSGPADPTAAGASFTIEPVEGTDIVRLRTADGTYIHAEFGYPAAGALSAGFISTHWVLEPVSGNVKRLRNRWTGQYLHSEQGGLNYGAVGAGWHSAWWVFE